MRVNVATNVELFLQRTDRTVRVVREAVRCGIEPFDLPLFWDVWLGFNFAVVGFIADGQRRYAPTTR